MVRRGQEKRKNLAKLAGKINKEYETKFRNLVNKQLEAEK